MICDCSIFHKQLDFLEIRLNELSDYVDKFVVVEHNITLLGRDKKLELKDYLESGGFREFKDRIIYLNPKNDNLSRTPEKWQEREAMQFNFILEGLKECKDDDLIIFSMGDEIPRGSSIKKVGDNIYENDVLYGFEQYYCRYWVNAVVTDVNFTPYVGSKIATYKTAKNSNLYQIRGSANKRDHPYRIQNGGWHFCGTGPVERFLDRKSTYGHGSLEPIKNEDVIKWTNFFSTKADVGSILVSPEGQSVKIVSNAELELPVYVLQPKFAYLFNGGYCDEQ